MAIVKNGKIRLTALPARPSRLKPLSCTHADSCWLNSSALAWAELSPIDRWKVVETCSIHTGSCWAIWPASCSIAGIRTTMSNTVNRAAAAKIAPVPAPGR